MMGFIRRFFGSNYILRDDLRQVLLRERSRADRTNSEFCYVWFSDQQVKDRQFAAELLDEKLRRRTRLTDYVGQSPEGNVWLVLVDCPAEACLKLVQEVLQGSPACLNDLRPYIYHYPGELYDLEAANILPERWFETADASDVESASAELAGSMNDDYRTNSVAVEPMGPLLEVPMSISKRGADILAASIGLTLFSPLLVLIGLLIRWESPGPAIFAQQRTGRGNRAFRMYKFRTMVADAEDLQQTLRVANEQDGPAFKMENDPRVTRLGKWLRATSMDEVPQLWNVLRGEMSLVGPRPLPIAEGQQCKRWQRHRESITPGLTCLWQVQDRRNKILFDEWVRLDLRYIREISHLVDVKLLVLTLLVALRRRGI